MVQFQSGAQPLESRDLPLQLCQGVEDPIERGTRVFHFQNPTFQLDISLLEDILPTEVLV